MCNFIFGYGSLINPAGIAKTLGREPRAADMLPVRVSSVERSWAYWQQIVLPDGSQRPARFLGLRQASGEHASAVHTNGLAFRVTPTELRDFDDRELHYDRIELPADAVTPLTTDAEARPLDGPLYTYVIRPDAELPPRDAVLMSRYVHLVEAGAARWGEAFLREYHETTVPAGHETATPGERRDDPVPVETLNTGYEFPDAAQARASGRTFDD